MQKTIHQISDQLLALVDKESPYYTLDQLLEHGVPSFITSRMHVYLAEAIQNELSEISSDWINIENNSVKIAWKALQLACIDAAIIPTSELNNILIEATSDVMHVLVRPRKNMARFIFRDQDILPFAEIKKRCNELTIYKHFGTAIPMYMTKRNLDEISVDRCAQLIKNLDSRIVANYTPKEWLKKLEILFTLSRGELAPNLLAAFFEDKDLPDIAELFAKEQDNISKQMFLEILTNDPEPVVEKQDLEPKITPPEPKITPQSPSFKSEDNQEEMLNILGDISEGGVIEVDNFEEVNSLNALFVNPSDNEQSEDDQETDEPQDEDIQNFRTNLTSILDEARHSFKDVVEEDDDDDDEEEVEHLTENHEELSSVVADSTSSKFNTEPDVSDPKDEINEDDDEPVIISSGNSKTETNFSDSTEQGEEEFTSLADKFKAINYEDEDATNGSLDEINSADDTSNEDEIIVDDEFNDDSLFIEDEPSIDEQETSSDFSSKNTEINTEPTQVEEETTSTSLIDDENEVDFETEDDNKPMWARFLTQEQMNVITGEENESESEASSTHSSFIFDADVANNSNDENLASTFNSDDETSDSQAKAIVTLDAFLAPNKKKWIKNIFSGKKKAYAEGITEIAYFETWSQASEYLETEIFNHHKVDMFAEETIEFIDSMQTYFNQYKS